MARHDVGQTRTEDVWRHPRDGTPGDSRAVTAQIDERSLREAHAYDRWFDRDWGRCSSRVEHHALRKAVGSAGRLCVSTSAAAPGGPRKCSTATPRR